MCGWPEIYGRAAAGEEQREADREEAEAKLVLDVVDGDGVGPAEARDMAARYPCAGAAGAAGA